MRTPERNTTAAPRATTGRSGPSRTGCAGNMACPSSWRARGPGRSAMRSGSVSPAASPPSAPCWKRTCGTPSRTPTTWATSSCSWNTRAGKSSMETAWVSVSGARSGSSSLAGRTPGSLRRASRLRSKGNYPPSTRAFGLRSFHDQCTSHFVRTPNIGGFWHCTSTTSTYWARLGSGSIRPA